MEQGWWQGACGIDAAQAGGGGTRLSIDAGARLPSGACLAFVFLGVEAGLAAEVANLPGLEGSKVYKILNLDSGLSEKLFAQLARMVFRPLKGCRFDAFGSTLPFAGTQVCGYQPET